MTNTRKNGFASAMISSQVIELNRMGIKHYTKDRISNVLLFERGLRAEENFWGWEIEQTSPAAFTANREHKTTNASRNWEALHFVCPATVGEDSILPRGTILHDRKCRANSLHPRLPLGESWTRSGLRERTLVESQHLPRYCVKKPGFSPSGTSLRTGASSLPEGAFGVYRAEG